VRKFLLIVALAAAVVPAVNGGQKELTGRDPNVLNRIDFAPKPGAVIPMNATFRDENGRAVRLGDYFKDRPVVLAPVYYECPMLCSLTLNGLLRAARAIQPTAGRDFDIVAYSINPKEGSELAKAKADSYLTGYNRPGPDGRPLKTGWHFLTGDAASIDAVSKAINFNYVYDPKSDQYAHASGLVVATPDGRMSRALYGPEFSPRDLKLALVESGRGRIGTVTDKVLLYCYAFDGANGRYTMQVMRVVQLAGFTTAACLFTGVGFAVRRERRKDDHSSASGDQA
jgi:protein SCO1/2